MREQLVSLSETPLLPLTTIDFWTRRLSKLGGRSQTCGSRRSRSRWVCDFSVASSSEVCLLLPPDDRERERIRWNF